MAGLGLFIVMLALFLHEGNAIEDQFESLKNNDTCRQTLKRVEMFSNDGRCSPELQIDSALVLTLPRHSFSVLPNCVNCSVTLVAPKDKQIVATLYIVGTETSHSGKCDLNRLDIYDGNYENENNRLSGPDGICGCKFPSGGEYKSSNNSMTLHYQTTCKLMRIHGELELIVSVVDNGKSIKAK
ncbi:uncharacterized protein LOC132736620 [Ruditapes philippinarum]|uniref:uncharacterized protein LOC132736620 n=1 Tax=Ruditapes philippinarum TaxID=129788 RepID=UPI00295B04F0|nr:uncharacterized protein LOC132736620 [Ruditapes philippinarum]